MCESVFSVAAQGSLSLSAEELHSPGFCFCFVLFLLFCKVSCCFCSPVYVFTPPTCYLSLSSTYTLCGAVFPEGFTIGPHRHMGVRIVSVVDVLCYFVTLQHTFLNDVYQFE